MRITKRVRGYTYALLAVFFLGFHSVLIRYLSEQSVNTSLIATLRLFIGSFTLLIIYLLSFLGSRKGKKLKLKISYGTFFWLTVVGLGLNFIFFHAGLQYTFASNAILIETFSPVFVLLILIFFFPKRIPFLRSKSQLVSKLLFIVLAGSVGSSLLLINKPDDPTLNYDFKFLGDGLEFVAMIFFALFFIGSNEYKKRNLQTSSTLTTVHFLFFTGVLTALILPFVSDASGLLSLTMEQWGWIFVLGFFCTGLSYAFWHRASMYLKVVALALLFNLSAIFTVVLEYFVFGTSITWQILVAALLIVAASISAEMIYSKGEKNA